MVVWNLGKPQEEDPIYEPFILRRTTFPWPDSSIFTEDDLMEDIFQFFDVRDSFREEPGHEMLEEMLWELHTGRNP